MIFKNNPETSYRETINISPFERRRQDIILNGNLNLLNTEISNQYGDLESLMIL